MPSAKFFETQQRMAATVRCVQLPARCLQDTQLPRMAEIQQNTMPKRLKSYASRNLPTIRISPSTSYIQFNLHLQLLAATEHARANGVVLKGDIPIGISRNSVEAWTEPYYFNLNGQAGAPPDDFSVNGQNWGFPTYNWDVMEKDGYAWWMKRFRKDGGILRCLPHRPHPRFLPHLGNSDARRARSAGTVRARPAHDA